MQGRLSPLVRGQIQAFPWEDWRAEFASAQLDGWGLMEWTLDYHELYDNPLMTLDGQAEIRTLAQEYGLAIPSLTGDFFMQRPFFKEEAPMHQVLLDDLLRVLESCAQLGVDLILLPLVDNSSIQNAAQQDVLISGLERCNNLLLSEKLKIVFESDFPPARLGKFIALFDDRTYGINYDTGNSAALGYDCKEEVCIYGDRIANVHVKDREVGGATVPLGTGAAHLEEAFCILTQFNYQGNIILQTARATDGNHAGVLRDYRSMVYAWLEKASDES